MGNFKELWYKGGLFPIDYLLAVRNLCCLCDLKVGSIVIGVYTLFYSSCSASLSLIGCKPKDMKGAEAVITVLHGFALLNLVAASAIFILTIVFFIFGFGEKKSYLVIEVYTILYAIHNLTYYFYNIMITITIFFADCHSKDGIMEFQIHYITNNYLAFVIFVWNYFLVNAYFNVVIYSYRKRLEKPIESEGARLSRI